MGRKSVLMDQEIGAGRWLSALRKCARKSRKRGDRERGWIRIQKQEEEEQLCVGIVSM